MNHNTLWKSLQTTSTSSCRRVWLLTSSVLSTTSKQFFEQPAASFLVCSLIFIELTFYRSALFAFAAYSSLRLIICFCTKQRYDIEYKEDYCTKDCFDITCCSVTNCPTKKFSIGPSRVEWVINWVWLTPSGEGTYTFSKFCCNGAISVPERRRVVTRVFRR